MFCDSRRWSYLNCTVFFDIFIVYLQFSLTPEMIGLIFLVMAAVYAASSPFGGWLSDKMVCILKYAFEIIKTVTLLKNHLLGNHAWTIS